MTLIQLEREVICFAGDSGDGIQLLGAALFALTVGNTDRSYT